MISFLKLWNIIVQAAQLYNKNTMIWQKWCEWYLKQNNKKVFPKLFFNCVYSIQLQEHIANMLAGVCDLHVLRHGNVKSIENRFTWLIQHWNPIVYFRNLRCRDVQRVTRKLSIIFETTYLSSGCPGKWLTVIIKVRSINIIWSLAPRTAKALEQYN